MSSSLPMAGLASVLAAASCSSDSPAPPAESGTGGAPTAEPSPGFVFGESDVSGPDGSSAGALDSAGCLGETRQAEAIDLDMYVMLDLSGSMLDPLPALLSPSTKWDAVRGSLESFVRAPETNGIGIGLQYFPQASSGVPFACTSNADCGSGGPCTSSLCVAEGRLDSAEDGSLEFQRATGDGGTLCASDADCQTSGGSCRALPGACVFPPQASRADPSAHFANVSDSPETSVATALCESQQDCAGIANSRCEVVGLCSLAPVQCTTSVGCPPEAGICQPFPYTCAGYTSCDTARYAEPAVPISDAATHGDALIASLRAQLPVGATPTGPALAGAIEHSRVWAEQHPGRQVVTVLATDGFPTVCEPVEIPDVAELARLGASGPLPVRTFVIGVFGDADLGADGQARLDQLARAGGTDRALVVNTAGDVARDFLAALNAIRSTAVSCDFQLDTDASLDFDRVNLRLTDAAGATLELPSVSDGSACGDGAGWYYVRDAAGVPAQLRVCPATCEQLERERARVDLQIGCVTRIR